MKFREYLKEYANDTEETVIARLFDMLLSKNTKKKTGKIHGIEFEDYTFTKKELVNIFKDETMANSFFNTTVPTRNSDFGMIGKLVNKINKRTNKDVSEVIFTPKGNKLVVRLEFGGMLESEDFEPHMMYDPKTGKGYKADKIEDHLRMKKLGYVHEKTFKEYSKY